MAIPGYPRGVPLPGVDFRVFRGFPGFSGFSWIFGIFMEFRDFRDFRGFGGTPGVPWTPPPDGGTLPSYRGVMGDAISREWRTSENRRPAHPPIILDP
jgi:hypothetical protein